MTEKESRKLLLKRGFMSRESLDRFIKEHEDRLREWRRLAKKVDAEIEKEKSHESQHTGRKGI